jgi:hypothetical protein
MRQFKPNLTLEEDEWFVLSEESAGGDPYGVCIQNKCPETDHVWFREQCEKLESTKVCPRGMELLSNPLGDGKLS